MKFTHISTLVETPPPNSTSRIAVQIVTGIGVLWAEIRLKGELFDNKNSDNTLNKKAVNLATVASL